MLKPRDAVHAIPTYHPPLAGRNGLGLDFNENTVGCSPRVLERLRQITADDLARYPEKQLAEEKMANFLGVASSELLLTNGADEAIHLLCQTYLEPGEHAVIVVPTYSMYRIYIAAAGAEITSVPAGRRLRVPFCRSAGQSHAAHAAHRRGESEQPYGDFSAGEGSVGSGRICAEYGGVGR